MTRFGTLAVFVLAITTDVFGNTTFRAENGDTYEMRRGVLGDTEIRNRATGERCNFRRSAIGVTYGNCNEKDMR